MCHWTLQSARALRSHLALSAPRARARRRVVLGAVPAHAPRARAAAFKARPYWVKRGDKEVIVKPLLRRETFRVRVECDIIVGRTLGLDGVEGARIIEILAIGVGGFAFFGQQIKLRRLGPPILGHS